MNSILIIIALFFALSDAREPVGETLFLDASTDISEQALEVLAEGEGSTYFGIPWQVEASSTLEPQEVDLTGVPDMLGPVFGDMEVAPGDRITFELIDVYPGTVWDDLALSEVYLIGR